MAYVTLSNLNLLIKLAERARTIAAASEVERLESELSDYDISTNGFIEDIATVEIVNTKQIEKKEVIS